MNHTVEITDEQLLAGVALIGLYASGEAACSVLHAMGLIELAQQAAIRDHANGDRLASKIAEMMDIALVSEAGESEIVQ